MRFCVGHSFLRAGEMRAEPAAEQRFPERRDIDGGLNRWGWSKPRLGEQVRINLERANADVPPKNQSINQTKTGAEFGLLNQ